jgi:hypothetical protein
MPRRERRWVGWLPRPQLLHCSTFFCGVAAEGPRTVVASSCPYTQRPESRGIDGGQRPEIADACSDESPKKCYRLRLPRSRAFGNRGDSIHRRKLAKFRPSPQPSRGENVGLTRSSIDPDFVCGSVTRLA